MGVSRGLVLVALLVAASGGAFAQQSAAGAGSAAIAEEVRGIRVAIERLTGLLEEVEFHQRVDVLLRRIEMHERRLDPLEGRLRSAQSEVENLANELKMLERMREQHDEQLEGEIRDGTDVPRSDTRRMLEDIERTIAGLEERSEGARIRAQQHENDLASGRREIEILDEMLLELLDED